MLITVSIPRRRARPRKPQRVARQRQPGLRVKGDDVLGRDDVQHLHARPDLREAQEVQRGVRIELARLPERGIGHDHRPHLGELDEQDVPRPADRRRGQPDEALDAVDEGEEPGERDPDPVVDRPHLVRIHGSLVSKGGVIDTATMPPQALAGARPAAAGRCAADAVGRLEPWPSRFSTDSAPGPRRADGGDVQHRSEAEHLRSHGVERQADGGRDVA